MQFITDKKTLREIVAQQKDSGNSVGLVPTMGNLHAGHLRLISEARSKCDFVVSTIFVNPLQFGPKEDLDAYPRTLDADRRLLEQQGCDALFAPSTEEVYGKDINHQSIVHVPLLSENYCGASRPGHFDGVATVVCKLFNMVAPDFAFFGLKDYQQFLVIKKMAADLAIPIRIEGVETVREESGLAMSSRNGYLSAEQKLLAANLYRCLTDSAAEIRNQSRAYSDIEDTAIERLENLGLQPDYFAICNAETLQAATPDDRSLVILAAVYIGPSRLIDNLRIQL